MPGGCEELYLILRRTDTAGTLPVGTFLTLLSGLWPGAVELGLAFSVGGTPESQECNGAYLIPSILLFLEYVSS